MFTEFLNGFAILISYFVFFIFIAVLIRVFIDIPTEIFRKTLHTILLGSTFVLVYGFDTWWIAAIASLSFIVILSYTNVGSTNTWFIQASHRTKHWRTKTKYDIDLFFIRFFDLTMLGYPWRTLLSTSFNFRLGVRGCSCSISWQTFW